MHRSGTSALAGLLELMGAYVGEPYELLLPDQDNPQGFFERLDVVTVNREIMAACSCNWHQVYRWNPNQTLSQQHKNELTKISETLKVHPISSLKDPRLCLTLPHWLAYFPSPLVILCHRDPAVIIDSLMKRNAIPTEYGLALWEYYSVCALRSVAVSAPQLRGIHSVAYESLIEDPTLVASQLTDRLPALSLPPGHLITRHIKPSLNRSAAAKDIKLSDWQEELAAMWRGDVALRRRIEVSKESLDILRTMEKTVSGSPAGS